VEPATSLLGSDVSYVKWKADARAFQTLAGIVFAGRVMLGTIDPIGESSSADLPVTKLFFAGGSGTVRGYAYQHLGPTDAEGNPLGGTSLLLGSGEMRFPIYQALSGVVFVDAGQISVEPWTWKPGELLYAAGPGLRYGTPLGPVRLDVGFPINPPKDTPSVQVWLSIGHAF
ncbi:MAG: autotransporter assembly complex protein TamA, partial [Solirubrobacteraceae bacterium]